MASGPLTWTLPQRYHPFQSTAPRQMKPTILLLALLFPIIARPQTPTQPMTDKVCDQQGKIYGDLDRGYLFAKGGPSFSGGGNTKVTVVSTSTDMSFINVGLYRHCSTALTAEFTSLVGPETYWALLTSPLLPTTTLLKGGFNCQAPWERLGQKPRGESQIFSRCHVRIVPLA